MNYKQNIKARFFYFFAHLSLLPRGHNGEIKPLMSQTGVEVFFIKEHKIFVF